MISAKDITKTYKNGAIETKVLKGIDFVAETGEWIAIMGRSGAGKSTFMYQLSLLDNPTSGEIVVNGKEAHTMSEYDKMLFRLNTFGYVFQDYALLPELTALENVIVPLMMQNRSNLVCDQLAKEALERVGLGHRMHNLPSQLSGGEQQRVSIARAIAHRPDILFADEPTANLDRESSQTVMGIFEELHTEGQTLIMVTHEEEYGKLAEKIAHMDDGKIVSITKNR